MPLPQAVLFDLDGTLIDSAPDLGAAADKMRTDRGLPSLDYALYRPMAGSGARGMLQIAFDMRPEHPDYEAYKDEFLANYECAMTVRTTIFDGVHDLLTDLAGFGLPWGVVTNKNQRFTLPLTAQLPMFAAAQTIISGDTTPHAKPHPEPLFEAARRLKLSPEHCWYVGDDERDIVAGKAAGMTTVAANYGYLGSQAQVMNWGADHIIHSPLALVDLLRQA